MVSAEFRPIVVGVNATLDAVIGPLNVAAEYVDRISKGDIPAKITDSYNGVRVWLLRVAGGILPQHRFHG